MAITTALLYLRVSSDEQARDGLSLDTQQTECRRYGARQEWSLGQEYTDILTGTRDDRPAYQQLLADVRAQRSQGVALVVVVAALDRFGRDLMERVRSRDELKALGVPIYSVREGGEVSDLVSNILASVAQEESRRLGERVRAVHQLTQERGWYLGHTPWGYRWREATELERAQGSPKRVIDVDDEAAPTVMLAFEQIAEGGSIRGVARALAMLSPGARGGCTLSVTVLAAVFRNAHYTAPAPARWPAIISPDLWQCAQASLEEHRHLRPQATGQYLLTGFLKCPRCGMRTVGAHGGQSESRRTWDHRHYRCAGGQHGQCGWSISMTGADRAVRSELAELLGACASPSFQRDLVRIWREAQQPGELEQARRLRLQRLQREQTQARAKLSRAAHLYVEGALDRTGYELVRDEESARLGTLDEEITRVDRTPSRRALPSVDELQRRLTDWRANLEAAAIPSQRLVLRALVRTVTVEHPRRAWNAPYYAQITWTELGAVLAELADPAAVDFSKEAAEGDSTPLFG